MAIGKDTITDSKAFAGKVYGTGKTRAPGRNIAKRIRNLKMHMRGTDLEKAVDTGKELAKKMPTAPVKKTVGLGQKAKEPAKAVAAAVRQKTLHTKGLQAEAASKPEFKMPKYDPKTAGKVKLKGQFETYHARETNKTAPKPAAQTKVRLTDGGALKEGKGKFKATKGFHELGTKDLSAYKAKIKPPVQAPTPAAPAKPSVASRVGKEIYKQTIGKVVEDFSTIGSKVSKAKEASKAARFFNVVAKSGPARAVAGFAMRNLGRAAAPVLLADTGYSAYKTARHGLSEGSGVDSFIKAGDALAEFDVRAKQARARGIVAKRSKSWPARILSQDPGIEVSVPNVKAAEKIAVKKAVSPKQLEINSQASANKISGMSLEDLSKVKTKKKKK